MYDSYVYVCINYIHTIFYKYFYLINLLIGNCDENVSL